MKILRYTFLLLIATLSLSSCAKFLEVEPTNKLTLKTYDDVRRLMGGHLRGYQDDRERLAGTSRLFSLDDEWLLMHFYADDYDSERYLNDISRNNIGKFQSSLDWGFRDASESIWRHHYGNIGFYNMIIQELEKNPSNTTALNEQVDAEARVLRAWSFFRLVQLYSPYKLNEYGLPINTSTADVGRYESVRQSQAENYRFIISELERVLTYTSEPKPSYNIFYDKKIVNALLAQVYLYKGGSGAGEPEDYRHAIKHAKAVLDAGIRSDITLSLPNSSHSDEYFGIHKDLDYTPLSFILNSDKFSSYISGNVFYGYLQYPSNSLLELFDDSDKRKEQFFDTNDGYVKKYDTDFIYDFGKIDYFRGSEMLLIIAESEARLGNEDRALTALAEFTQPRYTSYTRPAGKSILEAILIERRKEFCFDPYMRWLDLTRLQTGFSRKYTDNQQVEKEYRLQDGDYKFCLPIPQRAELDHANIKQNPGWS